MRRSIERALDPLMWAWCFVAWGLVIVIPITRHRDVWDRFKFWLLPFAGYYGYHERGITPWRWSERHR